ncbi:S-layer homology domain-containing protein [Ruminiclostridium cellobioparum]|uniref:S-layer homology domain-containing protein n=1 Tax=Ruminiclostridium cellobioparum TaxID=29355 RepID=UPI0028B2163E|nr:S-layer homology domain-containing protein [Ruminiclostridium cellobioparum]
MHLKKCPIFIIVFAVLFQINAGAYESLSYLYGGNTTTYINSVNVTGANLTTVCPDYFEINGNGTLKTTIKADFLFVYSIHAKGIKVIPYLSNNWDRTLGRAAVANRSAFAAELAAKVSELECDGVNVDIQNLTEADRDAFTDFVRLLRAALPKSKVLYVCTAANPWGLTTGWQGSYDYKALGSNSDMLFIMAYDEHYSGGTPGAVASLSFAEQSVKYALKYVPPAKVMLGIPFYGRYWKQGAAAGGYGITISDVERLVSAYKAVTWYDSSAQCARAALVLSDTDNAVIWGSSRLSAGTYDIWYENDTSIEKKLSLVSKYGLAGAGSWALGQEPQRIWKNYGLWLLGKPFVDIENHWAQSYILNLTQKGIISGFPDKRFVPNGNLTRAQAAALFVNFLGLRNEPGSGTFSDTAGHWAEKQISITKQYGIFAGYGGNLFYPNKNITREEFAVICDKVLYSPDTVNFSQKIYSDVSPEINPWSNKSIILLSMNNILSGYPDGTFKPGNTITRAEAVRVISAMLDYPGGFSVAPGKFKSPIPIEPH